MRKQIDDRCTVEAEVVVIEAVAIIECAREFEADLKSLRHLAETR